MSQTQSADTHSYQKDTTMSSTVSDMSQKFDKINIFNKSKSATAMPKVKVQRLINYDKLNIFKLKF